MSVARGSSAPRLALLGLALLRPLLGDALDGVDDLAGLHDRPPTADLPRSVYSTRGQAHVQDEDHRLVWSTRCSAQDGVEALAEAAELAERIDDAGRPVDAGDQQRASVRMPPSTRRRRSR